MLFRRLTRTVQPVSGEQVCLKGLGGSRFLSVCKWAEASLLTQTMLTEGDVSRQTTYVGSSSVFVCVLYAHASRGDVAHTRDMPSTNYLLTPKFEKKVTAKFNSINLMKLMCYIRSSFDPILPLLPVSLSFCLSLCLFFVKINLRRMLSSQLATQRDMGCSSLTPHAMMNGLWLALVKVCFLYSGIQSGRKPLILTPQYV